MNILSKLKQFFYLAEEEKAAAAAAAAAADILTFVASLALIPKNIQPQLAEIENLKTLPPEQQLTPFYKIYLELEKYLTEESGGKLTPELVKEKVREKFKLQETEALFTIPFLEKNRQQVEIYEELVRILVEALRPTLGGKALQDIIDQATIGSLLKGIAVTELGVDFKNVDDVFGMLKEDQLKPVFESFRKLLGTLVTKAQEVLGEKKAGEVFSTARTTLSNLSLMVPLAKELESLIPEPGTEVGVLKKEVIPVTPEARETFALLGLSEFIESGFIKDFRTQALNKGGTQIPISLTGTTLKDKQGVIQGIIVVAKDLRELKEYARRKLAAITPVLQKVSMGDFSESIQIPEEEDEFTEHMVALNLMVDDLKELTFGLEGQVKARTQELEATNQQLRATTQQLEASEQQLRATNQQLEMRKISLEEEVRKRTVELEEAKVGLEIQVAERTKELQNKLAELERFNRVAVGRELQMIELKNKIAQLEKQLKGANDGLAANPPPPPSSVTESVTEPKPISTTEEKSEALFPSEPRSGPVSTGNLKSLSDDEAEERLQRFLAKGKT